MEFGETNTFLLKHPVSKLKTHEISCFCQPCRPGTQVRVTQTLFQLSPTAPTRDFK